MLNLELIIVTFQVSFSLHFPCTPFTELSPCTSTSAACFTSSHICQFWPRRALRFAPCLSLQPPLYDSRNPSTSVRLLLFLPISHTTPFLYPAWSWRIHIMSTTWGIFLTSEVGKRPFTIGPWLFSFGPFHTCYLHLHSSYLSLSLSNMFNGSLMYSALLCF